MKIVCSEEETIDLALSFADNLKSGDIVVLNGNLGAGKTFFVRNVVKKFGIENVCSPTFAIVNEYTNSNKIYHFDFYRINNSAELFDIGYNDYLSDVEAITFIEWGNLIPEVLPQKRIEIEIKIESDYSREFNFVKYE
ncbi:MAG: tRNA (adenosine(37)-N6)-threonylcarbamoyltransferase complex ATPase subunit type 1 TsaE [Bacteroidetes bacterium]|nr:tRNA (adenosine(37)-N6)-threonylcarbamoyltransferase complex ATPase subunit type 1 TsaE [Bacteroidota bacterium]